MHLSFTIAGASEALHAPAPTDLSNASPSDYMSLLPNGGDSQLQRWSSLIGIITAIIGNILISFALNIQRYAHIRLHKEKLERREKSKSPSRSRNGYGTNGHNHAEEEEGQAGTEDLSRSFDSSSSRSSGGQDDGRKRDPTYLQSPYWWGGIALMTIGETGNFLAYGFAPASIVSPLGVVALVSNCVIAPIMLKEVFRLRDFWGVVVAVGGAATVVLSAKTEEKKLGPHEILDAITTLEFEIYMAVTIFLIGVLMWASPKYGNKTILVDLGLVGLFGGYTALSTKGVASMLSSTLWRAFSTPITYVLIVVLVGTAIMQVHYVNKALQRFDSTQVIPVQFVMFTLSVIIGSAILYRDFQTATADNLIKFVGGCLLTFFGVWLITSGRPDNEDDEEEDSDGEGEERIGLAEQDNIREESAQNQGSLRRRNKEPVDGTDGAYDSDTDSRRDSRRLSHVSFAETPPPLLRTRSNQSVRFVPTTSGPDPGESEESPLLNNPWKSSVGEALQAARHPGLPYTTSSPVLPSEAQISADSLKPPRTPRSSSHQNIHTHPDQQTGPTPPQADRPKTPRNSMTSRMLPGPLISPLSSGLSAVVADSLRRGMGSTSRKRSRLGLRRSRSGSQRLANAGEMEDDEYGTSPLKQSTTAESLERPGETEEPSSWSTRATRARSLSNTLGDLFRGKRQKVGTDPDEEAGPGGS